MHCNLRQPDAAQSLSALIRRACQVWSRSANPLPSLERFYCLYVMLRCDLELWPRDFNLLLTFDVEHLWCAGCAVVKLCTKVELNRAIRGGVIAVWTLTLYDLEHVPRVALCSVILYTKFRLCEAIRSFMKYDDFFMQTLSNLETTELYHRCTKSETLVAIASFWNDCSSKKSGQISHFLTPCKN